MKVDKSNWLLEDKNKYSFCHYESFQDVLKIEGKNEANEHVKKKPINLKDIYVINHEDKRVLALDYLNQIGTNGFAILQKENLLCEEYFNYHSREKAHIMMSVTKSLLGLFVLNEIYNNKLEFETPLKEYIKEYEGKLIGEVKLREVLDMQVDLDFSEDYSNPNADIWQYSLAMGTIVDSNNQVSETSLKDELIKLECNSLKANFKYITPLSDLLNMILKRVTQNSLYDNLKKYYSVNDLLFSLYIAKDKEGVEVASGGLAITLLDAVNIGKEVINSKNGSYFNENIIKDIFTEEKKYKTKYQGSLQSKQNGRKDWYYKNHFWVIDSIEREIAMIGVYGQVIYLNFSRDIVVVKQGAYKNASDDILSYQIEVIRQIVKNI